MPVVQIDVQLPPRRRARLERDRDHAAAAVGGGRAHGGGAGERRAAVTEVAGAVLSTRRRTRPCWSSSSRRRRARRRAGRRARRRRRCCPRSTCTAPRCGAQIVVQVPAPAGERWKVTETSARSEVAVADSATVLRSGVPGSLRATETPLKTAEVAKVVPALLEAATNVAWERPTPPERAAAASRTRRESGALHRGTAAGSAPASRQRPTTLNRAIRPAGEPDDQHPQVALAERRQGEADVGHAHAHARLLALGEVERPRVGGLVGVALGAERALPSSSVVISAIRWVTRPAGPEPAGGR